MQLMIRTKVIDTINTAFLVSSFLIRVKTKPSSSASEFTSRKKVLILIYHISGLTADDREKTNIEFSNGFLIYISNLQHAPQVSVLLHLWKWQNSILLFFLGGLRRAAGVSCRLVYTGFGLSKKFRIRLMFIRRFLHRHIYVECNNDIDRNNSKESTQQCESMGRQVA